MRKERYQENFNYKNQKRSSWSSKSQNGHTIYPRNWSLILTENMEDFLMMNSSSAPKTSNILSCLQVAFYCKVEFCLSSASSPGCCYSFVSSTEKPSPFPVLDISWIVLSINQPFILAGAICMRANFSVQRNITLPLRERPLFTLYFHFTLVLGA